MRVIIDFSGSSPDHWAGTVSEEEGAEPVRFDGRLDLLRFLESVITRALDHQTGAAT